MSVRINGPDVLTRREVAALFGVHPSTVTRWVQRGLLAGTRTPGGQHRYRREDVERLLTLQKREDPSGLTRLR